MLKTLSAGAIGVRHASLDEGIRAAQAHNFKGLEFNVKDVADLVDAEGADAVRARFADHGVLPAVFGLPIDWRSSDDTWQQGLESLPRLAKASQAIGCSRTATWVMPCSNDREMKENRRFHIERFKPIAAILDAAGISLGLEFIGPKTIRDSHKHDFVYTMGDMLDLGAEIGPNVGLLMDSYHWYTSHATLDELGKVKKEQIVYVHLNDAREGLEIDEQIDGIRRLPGETGVIDLKGFIRTLKAIGFDGPAAVEPFKKELDALPTDDDRLRIVSGALDKVLAYQ